LIKFYSFLVIGINLCSLVYYSLGVKLIGVRVGDHDTSKERDCEYDNKGIEVMCADRYQDFGIDDFHFHPDYNTVAGRNDIALIRLNDTVDFKPNIKPICLPFGTAATLIHKNVRIINIFFLFNSVKQEIIKKKAAKKFYEFYLFCF